MSQSKKRVRLFNCDYTYKLEPVEELLNKFSILVEFVENHTFRLAQMSEMVDKIPQLEMDVAFFVVHAHESRLSINEDNAGIGYAKIYRALRKETDGNVIIVIGGDDNYKGKDEENGEVISRWAKRKISSQFSEEYLDGRKSLIFSWNEGHRPIHEDALHHYFDPEKKGQKFYVRKTATPSPAEGSEKEHPPMGETTPSVEKSKGRQDRLKKPLCPTSPPPEDKEEIGKVQSSVPGDRFHSLQAETGTTNKSEAQVFTKDLAIIAYNVSESSMKDVRKVMEDITEKLNLSQCPPITQLSSISEVEKQLMDSYPRVCVLVNDADQIIRTRGNPPEKINEYRQLWETAETHVGEKVVLLICGSPQLSSVDVVKDGIKGMGKVVPACLKKGKFNLDVLDVCQIIAPTSVDATRNPLNGNTLDFQQPLSFGSAHSGQPQGYHETLAKEWETIGEKTPPFVRQQPQGATRNLYNTPTAPVITRNTIIPGWVILKSKLHNGRIYRCPPLEMGSERFNVPDDITKSLLQKYSMISVADVRIIEDDQGKMRYTVELTSAEDPKQGVEIADNETLMLNTLVRDGCVSFEPRDVKYRDDPNWQLPEFIMEEMRREYKTAPKVDLFVIKDEKGGLRYKAILGAINTAIDKGKKLTGRVKTLFQASDNIWQRP